MRYRWLLSLVLAAFTLLPWTRVALAQTPDTVTETFFVPARDPGIQLHVRNKRPAGVTTFGPERIVLLVHGATYPSETGFDMPLGGMSWMDYVARRGWDVYAMDLRGYGRSTRPPEMDRPASESKPLVNTDVAVRDVGAVVDHLLARRGVPRINLLGWSWGTTIMGAYTSQNNAKVERLVLYAPLWLLKDPPPIGGQGPLGAYRTVTRDASKQRWLRAVPSGREKEIAPDEWFDAWWSANLATDPVGAAQNPPVVRAPNGIIEDLRKYWMAGRPYFDPGKITVPTLLILAEWDKDTPPYMAQAVFEKLTGTRIKCLVMLGEGTHAVALEKNRMQLYREVQLFLEEPGP
ncbi:MAG: alpha/beta fold hydrolase [Candidatus Rokubacteria bacterium]|nr:alpha/beta fold hydrolase [Candidatus Rokubacteria bacterium]